MPLNPIEEPSKEDNKEEDSVSIKMFERQPLDRESDYLRLDYLRFIDATS